MSSKKLVFPKNEEPFQEIIDPRDHFEILTDIINTLNERLDPQTKKLWDEICQRDIEKPCYYKSGLALLSSDLKKLSKEWKKEHDPVNIFSNMPDSFQSSTHHEKCQPKNDTCNFHAAKLKSDLSPEITNPPPIPKSFDNSLYDNIDFSVKDCISKIQEICTKENIRKLSNQTIKKILQAFLQLDLQNFPFRIVKRMLKIINKNENLSRHLLSKLYCLIHNTNFTKDDQVKEIFFSDIESQSSLPFGQILPGTFSKSAQKMKQILPVRSLLDTGSNCILLGFKTFIQWGFDEKILNKVNNCFISGSTGRQDIILGSIKMPLYLKTTNGFMRTNRLEILVTKPEFQLDFMILGGEIFNQIQLKIDYTQTELKATCNLAGQDHKIQPCNLELLYNCKVNHKEIYPEDEFCNITLKDTGFHYLQIDNLSKNPLEFPIVDLTSFSICYLNDKGWPIGPTKQDIEFSIPLLNPERSNFKENELNLRAVNVYFCVQDKNSYVPCKDSLTHLEGEGKPNKPEGKAKAKSCDVVQSTPLLETNLPHISYDLPGQNSLNSCQASQDELFNYQKQEQVIGEFGRSFLTNKEPQSTNPNLLTQQPKIESSLETSLIDKISFDTDTTNEIDNCQLKVDHLNSDLKKQLGCAVKHFSKIFAKSKYDIGDFNGFSARISTIPGKTAVQKERRLNQYHNDGVRETMSKLIENGVFGLSEEGHDEFCANLNVVAKPSGSNSLRMNSKADKHIQRMENKEDNSPTAFRMTFDLRDANSVTKDVGRLQLPTVDEARNFARDKLCSCLDLCNQFWSIRLEQSSKKVTNFYYNNRIYWHERLPQGAIGSPFTAQAAMNYTFSDNIFEQWKREYKIDSSKMPYDSYRQFILIYLDDILIGSKKSGRDSSFDQNELHLLCIQAAFFALEKAGWKVGLAKCSFLTQKFQFLGQVFDTTTNSTGLNEDRVKAILEWRSPRSIAETQSRLAVLSYWAPKLPGLRLVGLPLIHMVNKGIFKWGLEEEKCFTNLKFLIALQIRNHIHNPDFRLVITSDSSKVAIAACIFQLNPETGLLELLDTQTRILSPAERSYSAVQRENIAFFFGVQKFDSYLRNSATDNCILSDASGIQWLSRTKNYNSRSYEQMLYLCSIPNLEVLFCSGKALLLVDLLSRQYQDVFLNNRNPLSEIQSFFIPPISRAKIDSLARMTNEEMVDFIMSTPEPELVDVYDKRKMYHQNVHSTHVTKWNINLANETQLVAALKLGFGSPNTLNLPVFSDILKSHKNLSKSAQDFIVRNHNLQKLKKKIESLDLNPEIFDDLLTKYRNPSLKFAKDIDFEKNEKMAHPTQLETNVNSCDCITCKELSKNVSIPDKLSKIFKTNDIFNTFLQSTANILPHVKDSKIASLMQQKNETTCKNAKIMYNILLIQEILKLLNDQNFDITQENGSHLDIKVIPFSIDLESFSYKTVENKLHICTNKPFVLSPLEIKMIATQLLIFYKGNFQIEDQLNILYFPTIDHSFPYLNFQTGNLFNTEDKTVNFQPGDIILTITFDTPNVIFVNVSRDSLGQSFQENEMESFLTSQSNLTKLVSNCLERNLHQKIFESNEKPQNEKEEHISCLANFAQIDPNQFFDKKKKKPMCHFTSHRQILNQILLGNMLAKSQGIFSRSMMMSAQQDDFDDIIKNLKELPTHSSLDDFVLKSGILYKQKVLLGKEHLRLCLPKNIAQEIIFRLHNVKNFHFSADKMERLFAMNFYCHDMSKIIKSMTNNCLICTLYKGTHKKNISGDTRSFHQSLPGQHLGADIAYMPNSKKGFKYLLLIVDLISGFLIAYPLKKLDDVATAEKLRQYLTHYPAPSTILADGAFEFSGTFQKTASDHGIQIRTPITKRPQLYGSAEKSVKDFKNLVTKLTSSKGRENWDSYIPLCLQIYNSQTPYNIGIPKSSIFLGPLFYSKFFLLFSEPSTLEDMIQMQGSALNKLSKIRIKRLAKLSEKIGNCKKNFKTGQLCTDEISSSEKQTIDGSRALVATSKNIYKILEILENKLSAKIRDLTNGKIYVRSLAHLRKIDIQDIPHLNLNESLMFKEFPNARVNVLNLGSNEQHVTEETDETANTRVTRSGRSFFTQMKDIKYNPPLRNEEKIKQGSILKKQKISQYSAQVFLDNLDPAGFLAVKKALSLKRHLNLQLSNLENQILSGKLGSAIKKYNVQNTTKIRTPKKVKFRLQESNSTLENENFNSLSTNFMFLSITPADVSITEFDILLRKSNVH